MVDDAKVSGNPVLINTKILEMAKSKSIRLKTLNKLNVLSYIKRPYTIDIKTRV